MNFGYLLFSVHFAQNADYVCQGDCKGVFLVLIIATCVATLILVSVALVAIIQSFIKLKNEKEENTMRLLLDCVEKTGAKEQHVEIVKEKKDKIVYTLKMDYKRGDAQ